MTRTGAPEGASNYVLCERCSAVKESRRKRMCDACDSAYQAERAKERQLRRDPTNTNKLSRRRAAWKSAGLPAPTRECPEFCEICKRTDVNRRTEQPRALALDHCHKTGKFRGWLCFKCNVGLARLGDSLEGIRRAHNYLKRAYRGNEE